jgi:hypothetical protein
VKKKPIERFDVGKVKQVGFCLLPFGFLIADNQD